MQHQRSIVILDFGGQYAHLIASRVRRAGVFSEIRDADTPASELKHAAGIILSGGPQSVYDQKSPQGDPAIFELGVPVLGICYGLQWMSKALGGEVSEGKTKEYGPAELRIENGEFLPAGQAGKIDSGIPEKFTVWMSHGDEVSKLPDGFTRVATSDVCTNAGILNEDKKLFGVQFHPEVSHTEYGEVMLGNFIKQCDADPWSIESYASHISEEIKNEVGDRNVFMLVSGGVDSTVAFTLLNSILGTDRVQGLLVDTGLMRKNEIEQIERAFKPLGFTNLKIEDASEEFFQNLQGVREPELKRKTIGETFLAVQKRVSEDMQLTADDGWMLGQGTIYPDTIETGATKFADQIKTHHNRVEAVQQMIDAGLVIEPLKDLYKDEVRLLGEELGLPHDLVWRHPFPGPGLGVRILCNGDPSTPLRMTSVKDIAMQHCVLSVKSVGVQGDGRTYRNPIALFGELNDEAWSLATTVPNQSSDISRVVYCSSHKEPPEIVVGAYDVNRDRADLLREADSIAMEELQSADLYQSVWQFPVVLLPIGTSDGGQSIVLRPIESTDAMTANAAVLPFEALQKMTDRIMALDGIDMVFYDLTSKPPGTIEWE